MSSVIRVITLLCMLALFGSESILAVSVCRFDFREAVIRDSDYQRTLGEYGNEIFDFSYGQLFFRDVFGVFLNVGFLYEEGNRIGVETGRVSAEEMSVFILRPALTALIQYTGFGIRPFFEGGMGMFFFRISESGVEPAEVDGWKLGPLLRAGLNFSLRTLIAGKRGLGIAEEIDVDDIVLSLGAGYEVLGLFQSSGINLSNYYATLGVHLVY